MVKADLKRPIYLAFSYDEEIGCVAAPELIEAIKDYYEETPKYAIIGEPSMLQPVVGQKGICVYKTTVFGSAGRSSRIRNEVSAIHECARLVIWLEEYMNQLVANGAGLLVDLAIGQSVRLVDKELAVTKGAHARRE